MQRFDETFLDRLETLRLACRRQVRGFREGDRATRRRGGSGDFHSHRGYAPGDDLRRVDWNVYARSELAQAQMELLDDVELRQRLADEATRVVEKRFSLETQLASLDRLYASLAPGRPM